MRGIDMEANEYQCALCQGIFTKTWSDEDAIAETQSYWPGMTQEECATVCDDCYQKIHPETHPQEYQDSLLEAIEHTYRLARTDEVTGEILPVDAALKNLIKQVCTTFDIPPAMLGNPLVWAQAREICFECGGKLDTTKPYRFMEVRHEKGSPETMPIYANEECIVRSPNEPNWRMAIHVEASKAAYEMVLSKQERNDEVE
jgi:hypothetical protein